MGDNSKNKIYREIRDFIKQIEDSIKEITAVNYPARVVDTPLQARYNTAVQTINTEYPVLIKKYNSLRPTIVTFIREHRIASGELVMNPETGDLLFVPGGKPRESSVGGGRGGGSETETESGSGSESGSETETESETESETETESDTTVQSNPQPEEKPYLIPPGSDIYNDFADELHHTPKELNEKHPELYQKIAEGIKSGEIKQIDRNNNPVVSSDESMPEAYRTAKNPAVIRDMLGGLTQKSNELITKYDQMVEMCQPQTALALIKSQLKLKNIPLSEEPQKAKAADKQILQALGWNNNENRLLYDTNLVRKTAIPTANGLFSKFCYHKGKFAVFMSRHCQRDYSCMLNWIIIIAFRLVKNNPKKYSDEQIVELIKNLHKTLLEDILSGSGDFVRMFVSNDKNTTFYAESVKKLMSSYILNDNTLGPLVLGIKEEIQKLPEAAIDSRVRKTTVRLGGGMRDTVTRKHRDFRVEETAKHTRKHKIFTISLNKTRRTKT